jgi:alpha/beta hydrolase fold
MLPKCVSRIADIQTMHWLNIEREQNVFNKENKPRKGTRNETSNIITRRKESYNEFATGRFLPRAFMKYGWDLYAPDDRTRNNPYVSPLRASNDELKGLPPALVITAVSGNPPAKRDHVPPAEGAPWSGVSHCQDLHHWTRGSDTGLAGAVAAQAVGFGSAYKTDTADLDTTLAYNPGGPCRPVDRYRSGNYWYGTRYNHQSPECLRRLLGRIGQGARIELS